MQTAYELIFLFSSSVPCVSTLLAWVITGSQTRHNSSFLPLQSLQRDARRIFLWHWFHNAFAFSENSQWFLRIHHIKSTVLRVVFETFGQISPLTVSNLLFRCSLLDAFSFLSVCPNQNYLSKLDCHHTFSTKFIQYPSQMTIVLLGRIPIGSTVSETVYPSLVSSCFTFDSNCFILSCAFSRVTSSWRTVTVSYQSFDPLQTFRAGKAFKMYTLMSGVPNT